MITLSKTELIKVYLLLKKNEKEIDNILYSLQNRIERALYNHLSIEEIENISNLSQKDIDVLF